MKMNTQPLTNLEISLNELVESFRNLPTTPPDSHTYAVNFTVIDDYGNSVERKLLFRWNQENNKWELDAKAHELLITASH